MIFKRKARSLLTIQAAQFTGLAQALALIKRIRIDATVGERESFKCGDNFRLLDFYGVKLAEIVSFKHIDAEKAVGNFAFQTSRLFIRVEVSLECERTTLANLATDGFTYRSDLDRWKSVQAHVWVYNTFLGKNFPYAEKGSHIQSTELESMEDLDLKLIDHDC